MNLIRITGIISSKLPLAIFEPFLTSFEKANNVAAGSVALTVELPEAVLCGDEALVIDFQFGAWSQAEVTELHTLILMQNVD